MPWRPLGRKRTPARRARKVSTTRTRGWPWSLCATRHAWPSSRERWTLGWPRPPSTPRALACSMPSTVVAWNRMSGTWVRPRRGSARRREPRSSRRLARRTNVLQLPALDAYRELLVDNDVHFVEAHPAVAVGREGASAPTLQPGVERLRETIDVVLVHVDVRSQRADLACRAVSVQGAAPPRCTLSGESSTDAAARRGRRGRAPRPRRSRRRRSGRLAAGGSPAVGSGRLAGGPCRCGPARCGLPGS